MAIAGRVAIVPKGDYSGTEIYSRLDMVYYNRNSYVAKKESVGILPTDTEFWMLSATSTPSTAAEVGYDGTASGLSADNLQSAIDEIVGDYVVDSQLSETSLNPVQNKVVTGAIKETNNALGGIRFSVTENGLVRATWEG